MPTIFGWYCKQEKTLRFCPFCDRMIKKPSGGIRYDLTAASLRYRCSRHRHHQPGGTAVFHRTAQPDQCHPGVGTGSWTDYFSPHQSGCGSDPGGRGVSGICPAGAGPDGTHRGKISRLSSGQASVLRVGPTLFLCRGSLCGVAERIRRRGI